MIVSKRMHRLKNASFFFFFSFVWARWWYLACVCMCADGHIVYTLKMAGCFFFFSLRCGCYLQRKLIRFSNDDSRAFEISFSILWVTLSSIFTFFFFFRFAFLICALSLFCLSGCDLRFFFFVFMELRILFVLHPPPYFFPSIAAFLSSFAFLFVCCCLLLFLFFFFFFKHPASDVSLFATGLFFFFFFSFSNSLLRTRK